MFVELLVAVGAFTIGTAAHITLSLWYAGTDCVSWNMFSVNMHPFLNSANVCVRSTDVVEGSNASVTCGSALCTVDMCRDRCDCHTVQKGHWR